MLYRVIFTMLGFYTLGVLTYGFLKSHTVSIILYFKPLSLPFFRLGLTYERSVFEDREVDTFSLGLFFINVDIDFQTLYDVDAAQSDDSSL